jgi:hypothetical protein
MIDGYEAVADVGNIYSFFQEVPVIARHETIKEMFKASVI